MAFFSFHSINSNLEQASCLISTVSLCFVFFTRSYSPLKSAFPSGFFQSIAQLVEKLAKILKRFIYFLFYRRSKCDHLVGVTYRACKHESGRGHDVVYSALVLVSFGSLSGLILYTDYNYRSEFEIESKFHITR